MTRSIRKELNEARNLYKAGKREEAFEIYDRHYLENPDEMDHWDKVRYCWSIYYLHVKDATDETELMEYAERVTDIVNQEDLNKAPVCVYTRCVFKVVMFLKANEDWGFMTYWLEKLDPKLLSDFQSKSGGTVFPSNKEDYYRFLSKAYLECEDYEYCIRISREALDTFTDFAFNGDTWHRWRIAKSLKELGHPEEALTYLEDVIKVVKNWYILKEIAEDFYLMDDKVNAIIYAKEAAMTDDSAEMKVNVYLLIYRILKDSNPDLALKYAKLYLAIKLEKGGYIDEEIEDLDIDEDNLDIFELEREIRDT